VALKKTFFQEKTCVETHLQTGKESSILEAEREVNAGG
jgi:hypothetical protein